MLIKFLFKCIVYSQDWVFFSKYFFLSFYIEVFLLKIYIFFLIKITTTSHHSRPGLKRAVFRKTRN